MSDAALDADAAPVVFECELDAKPETVWRALTTPDILGEWLGPITNSDKDATRFEVDLPPAEGGPVSCEVIETRRPERLTVAWRPQAGNRGAPVDTEVTFTLTPTRQGGTHLRIEHGGLALAPPARAKPFALSSARGLGARSSKRGRRLDLRRSLVARFDRRPVRLDRAA